MDFTPKMNVERVLPEKKNLDEIAEESGLAIALVEGEKGQIAVSNDNSICRNLNPDNQFSPDCFRFCGQAFKNAVDPAKADRFECHAGLECRAVPVGTSDNPLVAIVGRTFLKAENYRKATERAISGDWRQYAPSELFENILLTGSITTLDKCVEQVQRLWPKYDPKAKKPEPAEPNDAEIKKTPDQAAALEIPSPKQHSRPGKDKSERLSVLVEQFNREVGLKPNITKPVAEPVTELPVEAVVDDPEETVLVPETAIVTATTSCPAPKEVLKVTRTTEASAWRSFFGSLLKKDYQKAVDAILEFLAHQYKFSSLLWLEKNENRLENAAAFGEMMTRKVRLGVASDDPRLIEASHNNKSLELGERPKGTPANTSADARKMHLFPIGVGDDISAAVAILDPIKDEKTKNRIARICHSIAPQLEILRLRSEIARGKSVSAAVRKFSETLKKIDADDLLITLTQNAAEMLGAERASLMIYDDKAEALEIKAIVGIRSFRPNGAPGGRVANVVFGRKAPVIVADVATTGLSPAAADREYRTASFMICPISVGGRTIGVMNFADRASGLPFDRRSLDLFLAIAPQLAVAVDRASLKEKAGEFEQLSVTDALTGLLNRRYIEERLMEEIKRSNRHGFPMSFMMLDVDHFKTYNDGFGHPAGDEALKLVGHVIRETLRGADVAARFGGEEFSILLPQTTADEAAAIAERIRANVEEANFRHRKVTISIGIASCSADLCTSANIVSAADKALYEAKHRGRNTVISFEKMHVAAE